MVAAAIGVLSEVPLLTFVCSDGWSEGAVGQGPVSRTRAQWPASTSDHSTTITCLVNAQL